MTLGKAIEVKEDYHEQYCRHMTSEVRDADKLSIEALKAISAWRLLHNNNLLISLPGETKD